MQKQDVIDRLRTAIEVAGSRRAFALEHGLSVQYISDVLRGKRDPGASILLALGLEKIVSYKDNDHANTDDPKRAG